MVSAEKETPFSGQTIDLMDRYLQWVGRFPLLGAEQEVEMARAIELGRAAMIELQEMTTDEQSAAGSDKLLGEVKQGQAARRDLTTANLRLVVSIAKHYPIPGSEPMDVIQQGNLGLIEAVDTFNWRRQCRFSTYGKTKIESAIKDTPMGIFSVPRRQVRKHEKVTEASCRLEAALGRTPSAAELADETDYTEGEIKSYAGWSAIFDPALDETSNELSEMATYDNYDGAPVSSAELKPVIDQALEGLSEKQKAVIISYFGLNGAVPLKLKEIGERHGMSESGVSYMIKRAKAKLKSGKYASELTELAALLP